jgi:molybdopterin converting factor subunit 1
MSEKQIEVTVKFFAAPREALGVDAVTLALPGGSTVAALRARLADTYPALQPYLASLSVAVNRTYVDSATVLHPGDEVACLPPVAGG